MHLATTLSVTFYSSGGTPFSARALLVGFSTTKDITKGTQIFFLKLNADLNGNEIQIQTKN